MSEFKINNFDLFTAASNNVTQTVANMNNLIYEAESLMSKLHSNEVFKGPVSDNCYSAWKTINSTLKTSADDLTKAAIYLNSTSANYQTSDNVNASNIGSV